MTLLPAVVPEILNRESPPSVVPEILNRESTFLLFPLIFNTVDPGLKIAGVTRKWESKCFKYCGPLIKPFRGDEQGGDKGIQG